MKRVTIATVIMTMLIASCATMYNPIIDSKNVDYGKYWVDLAECRQYAKQVDPVNEGLAGAVVGAALGAGLGAITGGLYGGVGRSARNGTVIGAASGAIGAGANAANDQKTIIRKCLEGRGYTVLR